MSRLYVDIVSTFDEATGTLRELLDDPALADSFMLVLSTEIFSLLAGSPRAEQMLRISLANLIRTQHERKNNGR